MVRKTTWVVVLGDFGRSPRMQYHALSLAQQAGNTVCVVAHHHSKPVAEISQNTHISLWTIRDTPSWIQSMPVRSFGLLLKAIVQVVQLCYCLLWKLPRPDTVLVQSPPAIPTLALCSLACWWYGAIMIIDWHNFGYSIMALTMGQSSMLVRIARWYEQTFGRKGHKHLCVSKAMQHFLRHQWNIKATVFYDTPPSWFQRASVEQAHELLDRLTPALSCQSQSTPALSNENQQQMQPGTNQQQAQDGQGEHKQQQGQQPQQQQFQQQQQQPQQQQQQQQQQQSQGWMLSGNPFTRAVNGSSQWKADRPALVVSSTSWTVDEDFGILLEAGVLYDAESRASMNMLPNLVIVVTGKGPQKAMYETKMRELNLQHVAFRTAWLQAADYPVLLGLADLGISLHTSSSELDLPMKIVDMFGCGLPVCAARYSCIDELVMENSTGLLFDSPQQLCSQLVDLFDGFPQHKSLILLHMQKQVLKSTGRWPSNWAKIKPMFQ